MTNILNFRRDITKEQDGVWMAWMGEIECLIAPISCPAFESYYRRVTKPHQRRMRNGDLPDDVLENLSKKGVATHILLDWRGVELPEDGLSGTSTTLVKTEYSPELALQLFEHPQMKTFFRDIVQMSSSEESFRVDTLDDSAKN